MRSLFIKGFLCVFFASVVSFSAQAQKVTNLYSASWAVTDQSTSQRHSAIVRAFAEVLVKVSGSKSVTQSETIKSALGDAQNYMRLYTYKKLSAAEQLVLEKPYLLVATFDSRSVLELLRSANQPIWSSDRPLGTYQIEVNENGDSYFASEKGDMAGAALKFAADSRGLPVTFSGSSSTSDYQLKGQLSEQSGQWKGSWALGMGEKSQSFSTTGNTQLEAIQSMTNRIADNFASRLAVVLTNQKQTVFVMIENIQTIENYANAKNYMENLSMVEHANAIQIRQDQVLFQVEALSNAQSLIDALEMGNNLRRSTSSDGGDYAQFRWVQ